MVSKKKITKNGTGIRLNIETGEGRKLTPGDGPLFYILPPLIVSAVFAYCAIDRPDSVPARPAGAVKQVKGDGEEKAAAAQGTDSAAEMEDDVGTPDSSADEDPGSGDDTASDETEEEEEEEEEPAE